MIKVSAQCNDRPIINDFSPQTGFIGSTVTITGANFSATPSENQVFFGATQATVVSSSFGTLEVRVPEGSTTALISVKNQCNLSAYSKTHFNGVFCPTPLTNTSYQNTAQELAVSYGAYNMVSQDMDNDGKPDMVIAGLNGGLSIAKNNSTPGTISFSSYNFPSATRTIAVADFDGDGFKDLATNSNIIKNTSTGPGVFGLAIALNDSRGVSSYQIGTGDFNNDGKIDIIGSAGSGIYVAFNISTGPGNFNFTARQLVGNAGTQCTGIQVADVDGDGKADFLGSQGNSNRAVSLRNTTVNGSLTASFETPEFWASDSNPSDGLGQYPYRAMIADFDKDGKIDFTSCNFRGSANVAIWRNISTVGNIAFAPTINLPSPGSNYRIGVGDVDGDGYPDVVTKSSGTNVFSVYKNTTTNSGNITFNGRLDFTSSSRAEVSGLAIGDLDGDFVPDIATSGISSRTIRFHRNTGGQNDVTPPTVSCKDITVALSPNGTVTITPEMIDNGSGDACGIESLVLSKIHFTCNDIGENTVTLTATDGAGNQSSCTAIVNVQPAAIIVAGQSTVCQGETVEMSANNGDSYQWKKDGIDIIGAIFQNYIASASGNYTVVVTNSGGCSGESLVTPVVVNENPTVDISPVGTAFLCPPNNSTTLTATQSSIYQWMKDGVDIPDATQQTYEATTAGNYSVRVIDLFGCSATSESTLITANSAEIEVTNNGTNVSNVATTITDGFNLDYGNVLPNNSYDTLITIDNTSAPADNAILDVDVIISGPDAQYLSIVDLALPVGISPGTQANFALVFNGPDIRAYNATVTILSNDCDESSISINVSAEITCEAASFDAVPENISVNTDEDVCGALINYEVLTSGNPSPELTYSFSGATSGSGNSSGSGMLFNVGVTTVTLNLQNACGNATETFDVLVTDNQAPVISSSGSSITLNDPNGNGVFNASDNTTSPLTATPSEFGTLGWFNSGGLKCFGNASGNYSGSPTFNGLFNINANGTYSTAMTFSNGDEINSSSGTTGWGIISYLPVGNHNVGFRTASNHFGYMNITYDGSNITINNMVVNPVAGEGIIVGSSGQSNITTNVAPNTCAAVVNFSLETTDNCSSVLTYSPASGSSFPVGTTNVIATATDPSGNVTTTNFDVTVVDNQNPDIVSTNNITVELNANGNASITPEMIGTATDNCEIFSLSLDIFNFDCSNIGENDVVFTATDINGNSSSAIATVTVQDNSAPIFLTTETAFALLDENGIATYNTENFNTDTVTDNCEIDRLEFGQTSFNCDEIGFHTILVTAYDVNGNSTVGSIEFEVREETSPTVITKNIDVILDSNGNATITPEMVDNGTFDNCSFTLSLDNTTFSCENVGANIVNLTATDNHGLSTTMPATVNVIDDIAPTVITQSTTVTLMNGEATITPEDVNSGTFDNCTFTLSLDNDRFTCNDIGDNLVNLTATDASGNTTSQSTIVNVVGDIPTVSINDFYSVATQKVNTIFLGFAETVNLTTVVSGGSGFTYEWTTSSGEIISNEANPSIMPDVSTTYNVTVTNSNGCSASTSLYVCVIDARGFDKRGRANGKVVVCHHTNGKKGTKHVQIEISSNAVMKHLTKHGAGTDHADKLGGCNATCIDNTFSKGGNTKTVKAPSIADNLSIYPNPSSGIFDVRLTTVNLDTDILLFDINGKLIESQSISKEISSKNIITIGNLNLSSGIYILKIITKNETISKKLMITKD